MSRHPHQTCIHSRQMHSVLGEKKFIEQMCEEAFLLVRLFTVYFRQFSKGTEMFQMVCGWVCAGTDRVTPTPWVFVSQVRPIRQSLLLTLSSFSLLLGLHLLKDMSSDHGRKALRWTSGMCVISHLPIQRSLQEQPSLHAFPECSPGPRHPRDEASNASEQPSLCSYNKHFTWQVWWRFTDEQTSPCPPKKKEEKVNRYPTSYKRRKTVVTTIIQIKRTCFVKNGLYSFRIVATNLVAKTADMYSLTSGQKFEVGLKLLKSVLERRCFLRRLQGEPFPWLYQFLVATRIPSLVLHHSNFCFCSNIAHSSPACLLHGYM